MLPERGCARRIIRLAGLLLAGCAALWTAPAPAGVPVWDAGQAGAQYEVALVTVGPGDVYWERFGHNAIWIRDSQSGQSITFNFGMFDFDQPNFLLNFLRGDMRYRLAAFDAEQDIAGYREQGRSVDVQALNLSPPQRQALVDALRTNLRPENREYRYDYFVDDCSTRVRDVLDRALNGAIAHALKSPSRGYTYRMHALRLTEPDFWLAHGIHAGLGPFADRPLSFWEEAFIPMELQKYLRDIQVHDDSGASVPLVASENRLNPSRIGWPHEEPPVWIWSFALAGLLLAALIESSARRPQNAGARTALAATMGLLWLAAGLTGALLLALWTLTSHVSAWANQNLLLFNPLALALLPAVVGLARQRPSTGFARKTAALMVGCAVFALLLKTLPMFRQHNIEWIAFWLPVHASAWRALARRGDASAGLITGR